MYWSSTQALSDGSVCLMGEIKSTNNLTHRAWRTRWFDLTWFDHFDILMKFNLMLKFSVKVIYAVIQWPDWVTPEKLDSPVCCYHVSVMVLSHIVSAKKQQQLQIAHSNWQISTPFAPVCVCVHDLNFAFKQFVLLFQFVHAVQDPNESSWWCWPHIV